MIEDDTRFGKGSCERYQLGNLRVDQAGVKGQSVRCQMFEAGPEIFMGQHALGRTAPGKGIEGSCGIEIRAVANADQPRSRNLAVAQIGRASCRERVCPYVSIRVVAVLLKQKKNNN